MKFLRRTPAASPPRTSTNKGKNAPQDKPPPAAPAAPAAPATHAANRVARHIVIEDQFGISDIGKVRETNQDAIIVDPVKHIYLLADGMGGHSGGEIASAMALNMLHAELGDANRGRARGIGTDTETDGDIEPSHNHSAFMSEIFQKVSETIRQKSINTQATDKGMGTTAIALMTAGDTFYVGHVGDSRLYLLTAAGTLIQLTRDHSLVVEAGLDTNTAKGKSLKHIVTRSVGHSHPLVVDALYFQPRQAGTFLICSDGLSGMISDAMIAETLRQRASATRICKDLIARTMDAGARDNVSLIVVQFTIVG